MHDLKMSCCSGIYKPIHRARPLLDESTHTLFVAAANNDLGRVHRALAAGANYEAGWGPVRLSPLQIACSKNGEAICQALLEAGADVNRRDLRQSTALHWGMEHASVTLIKLLLSAGAEVNASDNHQRTALHWAALSGRADLVTLLTSVGGDSALRDEHHCTPLDLAILAGHDEVAMTLRRARQDKGRTR